MADDLQKYLLSLPDKMHKPLGDRIADIANGLADAIRAAAPEGKTGALKRSVRAEKGSNDLEYIVEAGGPETTKSVGTRSYRRPVVIGSDDTQDIPKGGNASAVYDYALAIEYGTTHAPAHPFFWPTVRAKSQDIQSEVAAAVSDALNNS